MKVNEENEGKIKKRDRNFWRRDTLSWSSRTFLRNEKEVIFIAVIEYLLLDEWHNRD